MKYHHVMVRISGIFALICAMTLLIGGAQAQSATGVVRVAITGTDTTSCGSTSQPCRTPQYAIERLIVTSAGVRSFQGQVLIAAGTYGPTGDPSVAGVVGIGLGGNLTIRGGYSTSNWNTSNPAANPTILDGQNSKRGILITVPAATAPNCTITISGLTITNGLATGSDPYGGGILIDNCSNVRVSNVTIANNKAVGQDNTNAGPTSPGAGGGIAVRGSTTVKAGLTLSSVTLQNNQANGGNEGSGARGGLGNGGGLFAINSNVNASDLIVTGNTAKAGNAPGGSGAGGDGQLGDSLGGGIALIDTPTFTLNRLTVSNNSATGGNAAGTGGYGLGGGIFTERSAGTISNSTMSSNQAVGGNGSTGGGSEGGALHTTVTALTLANVTMVNNSATGGTGATPGEVYGGGLFMTSAGQSSSLTATNIIVAANVAAGIGFTGGGGMALRSTAFDISHATLADNVITSPSEGGQAAIFFLGGTSGTMRNSITSGHTGSNSFYVSNNASGITLNQLLINDTTTTLLVVDPNAQATTQNTITGNPAFVSPGSSNYNYRIGFGSAAINQASGSTVTTDIDGLARPIGGAADLGASEYQVGLSGTAGDTSIDLAWTPPPGTTVTSYQVVYTKEAGTNDANEGASPIDAGTDTSITLTGLSQRKTYTVKIIAFNGGTQVAESATLTFTTGRFFTNLPLVVN